MTNVTSVTITTVGSGYVVGDQLTIDATALGGTGTYTLGALTQPQILTEISWPVHDYWNHWYFMSLLANYLF